MLEKGSKVEVIFDWDVLGEPSRVVYKLLTLKGDLICTGDSLENDGAVSLDGLRKFTQSSYNEKDGWQYGWK